jgi:chemotaxis protein CheZ
MAIHRKRFRVEEAIVGEMPSPEMIEEAAPMHNEIMAELRAIRAQMAKGTAALVRQRGHGGDRRLHRPRAL